MEQVQRSTEVLCILPVGIITEDIIAVRHRIVGYLVVHTVYSYCQYAILVQFRSVDFTDTCDLIAVLSRFLNGLAAAAEGQLGIALEVQRKSGLRLQ